MKTLNINFKVILLISIFLISSKNIYSQWTIAGNLAGVDGRPTVSVVDQNTAFVTGGSGGPEINATYKTTNGGLNWIQLNTGTSRPFLCIWAKDANTVFAGEGVVYKTTNGGTNWTLIDSIFGTAFSIKGIQFSNSIPSFGIVLEQESSGSYTYKTRDGGNTWNRTPVSVGEVLAINGLNVVDSLFYAFGAAFISPSIIITTDGGVTWNLRDLNLPFSEFTNGVAFKDDKQTGIAGASLPIIARTTNGGLNWVNIDVGNNVTGTVCRMRWIQGTNTCYVSASDPTNGGILKSTNGGLNWTQMTTSGLGIYNFDTKRIGSNVYGYAISSLSGLVGGNQVLKVTDVITGINQISELVPEGYSLSQNYPNPFNPVTKIKFDITRDARRETQDVGLVIYNLLGKEVTTLVNENLQMGSYEVDFDGNNFSTGIYFYKLVVDGNIIDTKRMMLLK
ncbi:MAG: YCF48-related protein [bacterium]